MQYTPEQRQLISAEAEGNPLRRGKRIETLRYVEDGSYWRMTFTDRTLIEFRFMQELDDNWPTAGEA